jgi:hypothetical protein
MTDTSAEAAFADWFRKNYPGPDTIIHNPDWHAPKILRAAEHALSAHSEAQAAEIERLRGALQQVDQKVCYELNTGNYDHDDVCQLDEDWIEVGNIAEAALEAAND